MVEVMVCAEDQKVLRSFSHKVLSRELSKLLMGRDLFGEACF